MLREWEKKHPGRLETIFNALGKIEATHLLDRSLRDFASIRATGTPVPDGDLACDETAVLEDTASASAVYRVDRIDD